MELKRTVFTMLAFTLLLTGVACSKNETNTTEETPQIQENTVVDEKYIENYSKYYNDYIVGLNDYGMYETPAIVAEYYTTDEYPGNEVYFKNVQDAYKDTRDRVQSFVDSLKNDVTITDEALKTKNEALIKSGEQTIYNIDAKLKQLETYPESNMNLPQDEFIKSVYQSTTLENETKTDFNKLLEDMNNTLGINQNK